MAKSKKIKEVEEAYEEAVEAVEVVEAVVPVEVPTAQVNTELVELIAIHNAMTVKGIKDIGQLEVLISRLQ